MPTPKKAPCPRPPKTKPVCKPEGFSTKARLSQRANNNAFFTKARQKEGRDAPRDWQGDQGGATNEKFFRAAIEQDMYEAARAGWQKGRKKG